ncbi:hypothetical protein FQR65_LT19901 [Abscondita terminalis]|nr:hypothetical protein FQR65_LT19901 [Abscondita terminalis]
MKETAENWFGTKVTKAVITVPAYFNDAKDRQQKMLPAALAYGSDKNKTGKLLQYMTWVGGTLMNSFYNSIRDGVFELNSTNGDYKTLGEKILIEPIIDYLISEFKKENNIDLGKR